jgi:hypothetical protein
MQREAQPTFNYSRRPGFFAGGALALLLLVTSARAFSLLGPYANWMDTTNSFKQAWDIGGPMNLTEGYRWNVPVVTYAFDQSFLDFFGSNGVAAVEGALGILNALPAASQIDPSNYPPQMIRVNYQAQAKGLQDLKSQTLFLLTEHLGLAQPTRFVFSLHDFVITDNQVEGTVLHRNFDPFSLATSDSVNEVAYTDQLQYWVNGRQTNADAVEQLTDPSNPAFPSVADGAVDPGNFFTSLTRDDAGGVRYLLSSNNVQDEVLPLNVRGTGTNVSYVNRALRPGVEKITFVRQQFDSSGHAIPTTNAFVDTYVTNGLARHQDVERSILQPDFLFSVADLHEGNPIGPSIARTDTSAWWNSSGPPDSSPGPGVIMPPVKITFHRIGPSVQTADQFPEGTAFQDEHGWGSFDASSNPPLSYPYGTSSNEMTVHLWLRSGAGTVVTGFTWKLPAAAGQAVTLQTSTNLLQWISLASITNSGVVVDWNHLYLLPQRFFRLLPQ